MPFLRTYHPLHCAAEDGDVELVKVHRVACSARGLNDPRAALFCGLMQRLLVSRVDVNAKEPSKGCRATCHGHRAQPNGALNGELARCVWTQVDGIDVGCRR